MGHCGSKLCKILRLNLLLEHEMDPRSVMDQGSVLWSNKASYCTISLKSDIDNQGTVSLGLMTSQFKDILNQVQQTKVCKMHILWCMVSKFCVKFENVPFEISHKFFNTFSTKCAFMRYMKLPDIEFWHLKFYWDRSQGYLLITMPPCKFVEELRCYLFNSSPPGQNGRHFADDVFRCIFVSEKFLIQISLKFVPKG